MKKISLENQDIRMEILPSCGGKIYTFTSKTSGRQWLWHNPAIPLREPQYGDCYITKLDHGGWDEIFPSVLPCRIRLSADRELIVPDHGDLVSLPTVIEQPDPHTLITMTKGRYTDFTFERSIKLCGNLSELNYKVVNTGSHTFPFLWCAHPLIRFELGMKVDLGCVVPFTVESVFGASPFEAGDSFHWSGSSDFEKIPTPMDVNFKPFAMKFFSEANSVQSVSILSANEQEELIFSWDTPFIRHIGIWMNYGAWSGIGKEGPFCYSLGIEPGTSPVDNLGKAVEENTAIWLEPGEYREWSMEITLRRCLKVTYHKRESEHLLKSTRIQ